VLNYLIVVLEQHVILNVCKKLQLQKNYYNHNQNIIFSVSQ